MIDEAFGNRVSQETLEELLPDYREIDKKLIAYKGTNNRTANAILTEIMSIEERQCLEEAFFGNTGWYRTINGDGMIKLKLAAMSLEITNNIFTFKKEVEDKILDWIDKGCMCKEEQLLMMRCYVKQKIITYMTLLNYLKNIRQTDKMTIKLYRGINTPYQNQNYKFSGMESWSTNINIAYRFARDEGFVVEKEYPINQTFTFKRSTFKNLTNRLYKHSGFYVRRESEMIVENFEKELDCRNGKGIRLAISKEIY